MIQFTGILINGHKYPYIYYNKSCLFATTKSYLYRKFMWKISYCLLRSQKTPRGILPVNSNWKIMHITMDSRKSRNAWVGKCSFS